MNCNEYQEHASLFIDGELDMKEQIKLFGHLTQCGTCQSFVDASVRMKELQRAEQINYPIELDEAILSKLVSDKSVVRTSRHDVRERKYFWQKRITLPLSFAAATVIVAVIAGFLFGEIFIRKSETQTLPASWLQTQTQPTTVIMIYGIPPVEVFGKSLVQTRNNVKYQN
jgi:hypothetical protein